MSCARIDPLLVEHAYGELSPEVAREVEAHVAGCAACAEALQGLRETLALVRELPEEEPSEAGVSALLAEAERIAGLASRRRRWDRGRRWVGGLAAAAAVAVTSAVLLRIGVPGRMAEKTAEVEVAAAPGVDQRDSDRVTGAEAQVEPIAALEAAVPEAAVPEAAAPEAGDVAQAAIREERKAPKRALQRKATTAVAAEDKQAAPAPAREKAEKDVVAQRSSGAAALRDEAVAAPAETAAKAAGAATDAKAAKATGAAAPAEPPPPSPASRAEQVDAAIAALQPRAPALRAMKAPAAASESEAFESEAMATADAADEEMTEEDEPTLADARAAERDGDLDRALKLYLRIADERRGSADGRDALRAAARLEERRGRSASREKLVRRFASEYPGQSIGLGEAPAAAPSDD